MENIHSFYPRNLRRHNPILLMNLVHRRRLLGLLIFRALYRLEEEILLLPRSCRSRFPCRCDCPRLLDSLRSNCKSSSKLLFDL
uniref:Uncharacterized protein n=1 Tax=Pinctada fucata TaxID=50426 RepID=A0A194ALV1_PINFU